MKKLVLIAVILAAFSATSFAGFGLGVSLGAGQSKSDLKAVKDSMVAYEHKWNLGIFGVEAFYEHAGLFNLEEQHIFGIKVGYNGLGEESLKGLYFDLTYEEAKITYYEIPFMIYYKYAPSKWHWTAGAGAAFGKSKLEVLGVGSDTISKTYPFIAAGVEHRFGKLFGLGLDLRYNLGAKFENEIGFVYRDLSGIQGALAARFYF